MILIEWSDIAECLTFLKRFPVKLEIYMFYGVKVMGGFSVTSNLAVTTSVVISYSRANFFVRQIFELKELVRSEN